MKRVERIEHMEQAMDSVSAAAGELERALEAWKAARAVRQELEAYYGSPQWKRDYAADEAGRLPKGLKRGVLSQDGVWDLLERCAALDRELARPPEE